MNPTPPKVQSVDEVVENLFEDTVGMTDYLDQFETTEDAHKFASACKNKMREALSTHDTALREALAEAGEGLKDDNDYTEGGWPPETEVEKDGYNTAITVYQALIRNSK